MTVRTVMADVIRLVRLLGRAHTAELPRTAVGRGRRGRGLRVVTYNVQHDTPDPDRTVGAIRAAEADLVCLQETTPPYERRVRAGLAGTYPHMLFDHRSGLGEDPACLSKWPIRQTAYFPAAGEWVFPASIFEADTPLGGIQLLNVHLTPPSDDDGLGMCVFLRTLRVRQRQVEAYTAKLRAGAPALVLGDFNEGDWGFALDWLRGQGYADALWPFDRRRCTWRRSDRPYLRERLDHIIYSPPLRCVAAEVIHAGASDHFPVVAAFERHG